MFDGITPVPAAGTSKTPPTTSRRAFGRHLGLSIHDVSTGVVRCI